MGIKSEIERIAAAKAALKTAINARGGSLTTEHLESYSAAVIALPQGADVSGVTATAADVAADKKFVTADGTLTDGTLAAVTQPAPTLSLNGSTGVVTASYTPLAGQVKDTAAKSGTLQLPTQGATSITPGSSAQVIAAGKFLTGDITVAPGQTDYYRCASVNTGNQTWTGYKAVLSNGIYTFEGTVTPGLTYDNVIIPVVGGIYTDGTLVTVKNLGIPTAGLIRYAALFSGQNNDELEYPLTFRGAHTFGIVDSVICDGIGTDGCIFYSDSIGISNLFTLSVWMKASLSEGSALVTFSGGNYGPGGDELWIELKQATFILSNGGTYDWEIFQTSTSGGWHHIAVAWTGSAFNVYIDGSKIGSSISADIGFASGMYLCVNSLWRAIYDVHGTGQYSSMRLYDRVLSDSEVTCLAAEFTPTA